MNTQAIRTAPRSPWQNAYVERVIGSIRRECLDHVIVMNAAGLHQVLRGYIACYVYTRTHSALDKDTPCPRRSHCRQAVALSPFHKSVDYTTATTASAGSHRRRRSQPIATSSRTFNTSVFR